MSPGPNPELTRVARAMLGEFDELLADITERVWSTVPGYSELLMDPAELRERVGESVRILLTCLLEGRAPSDDELARSSRAGERRALQGVSATTMIQSFRTTERVLGEELQGWCSRMQVRTAAARSARAGLIASLDALEQAMLGAHAEIQRQVETDDRLSEPALFRRLVAGAEIGSAEVLELARAVGLADPEDSQFLAVAVNAPDADRTDLEQHRHRLGATLGRRLGVPVLSGTVESIHGLVALLAVPWPATAESLLEPLEITATDVGGGTLRTAIGLPSHGISALGVSCRQAISTLAANRGRGADRALLYADSLLEVLVLNEPVVARRLVDRYLTALGPELRATLSTHFSLGLSLQATAERLGVHRNTVVYRLHRIEELTGTDLRRAEDIARLTVALRAAELHGAT